MSYRSPPANRFYDGPSLKRRSRRTRSNKSSHESTSEANTASTKSPRKIRTTVYALIDMAGPKRKKSTSSVNKAARPKTSATVFQRRRRLGLTSAAVGPEAACVAGAGEQFSNRLSDIKGSPGRITLR